MSPEKERAAATDPLLEERAPQSPIRCQHPDTYQNKEEAVTLPWDGHQEVAVLPGPPCHHPHPFPPPDLSLYPIPRPSAFHQVPSHTLNPWESQEACGEVGLRLCGRGLGPAYL